VREPNSGAVYAYGVEVTDLARCERQLRHAQRLELMGELSASIAHDFNNYLTGIAGELELALLRETSPAERAEFIQHAVHTCGHAARMVRTLLDFSRARELQCETIDVDATIASALPLLRHLVGKKVVLEHRPAPVPLFIEADPVAFEQILGNLAANARDAMTEGGRFSIGTRLVPFATDELPPRSGASAGSFVEVTATDTGSGMDTATAARVFEPFFTTKGPGRGTGLGLACVRELVEKQRGWIALDSQPGAGTAFRLYLPAASDSPDHSRIGGE
jgi:signal transduction histidine kinase